MLALRKSVLGVSNQVRFKLACSALENNWKLEANFQKFEAHLDWGIKCVDAQATQVLSQGGLVKISFFLSIPSRSILIIISGVVGG